MGRGNVCFRNYDGESIRTFFFDGSSYDETKAGIIEERKENILDEMRGENFAMRRRILTSAMLEGRYPIRVSDDYVGDRMGEDKVDEIGNLAYEIGALEFMERVAQREYEAEVTCGFNCSALVIARGKNVIVVVEDNESSTEIGCVPVRSFDSIDDQHDVDDYKDAAEADLIKAHKRADASYEITQSDIDDMASEMLHVAVQREYDKAVAEYKKEANIIMRKVHEFLGGNMRERAGAWCSSQLKSPEEMDAAGETYY